LASLRETFTGFIGVGFIVPTISMTFDHDAAVDDYLRAGGDGISINGSPIRRF